MRAAFHQVGAAWGYTVRHRRGASREKAQAGCLFYYAKQIAGLNVWQEKCPANAFYFFTSGTYYSLFTWCTAGRAPCR